MNIVVGYIDTPECSAALSRAVEEAHLRRARLVVVHSMKGGGQEPVELVVTYDEEMERIDERLTADGIDHQVRQLVRGNTPSDDLLLVAEEVGAELIVIGLRRRSQVGKLILGSNAQHVLLRADCAVLAVKPG